MRKTFSRRRFIRRFAAAGMVAGVIVAICSASAYVIVDHGLIESEPDGIIELREQTSQAQYHWFDGQVAWIKIYDTNIDYPVMQSSNNQWYLSHDFHDRDSVTGSIFLDYRNRSDFSDKLSILYGHRTNGHLMFSDVSRFADSDYFAAHSGGRLILPNMSYELKTVDFLRTEADSKIYRQLKANDYGGNVVALSTCNRGRHGQRDVLILRAVTDKTP